MSLKPRALKIEHLNQVEHLEPKLSLGGPLSSDSDSSTQSLVSILDHLSFSNSPKPQANSKINACESAEPTKEANDEDRNKSPPTSTNSRLNSNANSKDQDLVTSEKYSESSFIDEQTSLQQSESTTQPSSSLEADNISSPWAQWLLIKQKQVVSFNVGSKSKPKDDNPADDTNDAKNARDRKNESHVKRWLEHKQELNRDRLAKAAQERRRKREQAEHKEEVRRKRAQDSYSEWLNKKKALSLKEKQLSAREITNSTIEYELRREKNEQSFNEWLSSNRIAAASSKFNRNKTSFGYTSGSLTGYYDWSGYPFPSFYNPVPWKNVLCPKRLTIRKR